MSAKYTVPVFFIRHLQEEFRNTFMPHYDEVNNTMVVGFGYGMNGTWYPELDRYKSDNTLSKEVSLQNGFKVAHGKFKALTESENAIVWTVFDNTHFYIAEYVKVKSPFSKYKVNQKGSDCNDKLAGVTLKNVKRYDFAEYPVLLGLRPTQGTICNPNEVTAKIIRAIHNKEKLDPSVNLFHFNTLEQMCENFLRNSTLVSKYIAQEGIANLNQEDLAVSYCLTNVGKSLPHTDITAVNNAGEKLFAQVTFSKGNTQKENEFIKWLNSNKYNKTGIIFSPSPAYNINESSSTKLIHISIDKLYDFLLKTAPEMINDLHDGIVEIKPQLKRVA